MYNNNKIIKKKKQRKEEKQPPWSHQLKEKNFSLPGPALTPTNFLHVAYAALLLAVSFDTIL